MRYLKAADIDALPKGGKLKVTLEDKEILLVNIGGSIYAVSNKCTHMGGSLFDGHLEGTTVTCPRHGTAFDVTTGKVVGPGKLLFAKINPKDLETFSVKTDDTGISIGLE
jgi:3-phenylpropionate/trans-cinnamate dioxygenase ferredoxin subunit